MRCQPPANCKERQTMRGYLTRVMTKTLWLFCGWETILQQQCQTRRFCSTPGCQDVFVLQLFHFRQWHGDDNVVDVVHTLSLALANKALKGNMAKLRVRANVTVHTNDSEVLTHSESFYITGVSWWRFFFPVDWPAFSHLTHMHVRVFTWHSCRESVFNVKNHFTNFTSTHSRTLWSIVRFIITEN